MNPHDPLESLREAVSVEAGRRLPGWAAESLAEGIAYRLMRHCWEQSTDRIGAEWELRELLPGVPAGVLSAMLESGVVHVTHGEYVMPMAWREAPEYVRSRWRDTLTDEDRAKMRDRAQLASNLIREHLEERAEAEDEGEHAPEPEPEADPLDGGGQETNLWGEEMPETTKKKRKRRKTKTSPKQPHRQRIIDHWFEKYEEHYGQKPPFTQRDAHHLKTALAAFRGNPARLEDALERYLRCQEPFFRGHPLSLFINQLARWSDGGGRPASTGNRHGLDESIDTRIL